MLIEINNRRHYNLLYVLIEINNYNLLYVLIEINNRRQYNLLYVLIFCQITTYC